MTVAFVIALAVAVVAIALLVGALRRVATATARERSALEGHSADLDRARQEAHDAGAAADGARADAEAARADAAAARSEADDAARRAAEAERRAETFQAEILRAEAAAAERRVAAATTPAAGAVLWQLERLRCEREWSEVVGPGESLPVTWDETLGAVLATEMAIVREVIGTPGQVDVTDSVALSDLPQAAATVRLGVELVRALARSGEEMVVTVSADSVSVDQRVIGAPAPAGLDRLREVAQAAGSDITVDRGDQQVVARLALPLSGPLPTPRPVPADQ